jgi:DNA-directed RNA polymerase beta subunit
VSHPEPAPPVRLGRRTVIKAYFDEKGLVRQQLDSFDQFITNTVTEVVEDTPTLSLKPQPQYGPGTTPSEVCRAWLGRWR